MTTNKAAEAKATGEVAASGNFLVADGARLEGNFRCEGHARVGRAAVVDGSLHVAGSLAVREGASITGGVTCASDVDWHPTASTSSLSTTGAFRLGAHQLAGAIEAPEGVAPWGSKEGSE